MRDELKMVRDTNARSARVFNFLPLLASRCFLAELSRKLNPPAADCDLPPERRPYGSYGPEAATRAKRAVNPC